MCLSYLYKRKEIMNYMIRHTGTRHLEGSYSFDERTLYDCSGMTTVKTKCDCDFGKTISFYYDADDERKHQEQIAKAIELEIKASLIINFCIVTVVKNTYWKK